MDVIVPFVERLFSLDSSSPTQLRPASASSPEGGLWKATLAAAATLLMYYEERCAARPAQLARLTAQMRDCWSAGPGAAARRAAAASSSSRSSSSSGGGGCYIAHESAREVLLRWSRLITAEFRVANLHLTARTGPGGEGAASVVAAVGGIVDSVNESRRATVLTTLDLHRSLEAKLSALTVELRHLNVAGGAGGGAAAGAAESLGIAVRGRRRGGREERGPGE